MSRTCLCFLIVVSVSLLTISPVQAVPIDMSSWLADGPGDWTLQSEVEPNDSVYQSINSGPTIFFNNNNSQGLSLSTTVEVQTTVDDDFIGFVLGYDDNDLLGSNATTDYILVDWKQAAHPSWNAGMTISRVTGNIDTCKNCGSSDPWQHVGAVSVIQKATTLGDVGWADHTSYAFDIVFTSTNIKVDVDGVRQFDINGIFENGSAGFYNFSQQAVHYSGVSSASIPEPTTALLLGLGLVGLGLRKRLNSH